MNFQFDSVADFVTMGGHGIFVWLSYWVTVVALLWLVAAPLLRRKKMLASLRRQYARQGKNPASANEPEDQTSE